jgi:hypothetical protein
MTPRIDANHRSAVASKKSPMHAPAIDPAVLGAHPRNHRLSPMVKCKYMIMLPIFIDIPWSMFISMPLSWARAPTISDVRRIACPARRCIEIMVTLR